jgi:hypothetical protein
LEELALAYMSAPTAATATPATSQEIPA